MANQVKALSIRNTHITTRVKEEFNGHYSRYGFGFINLPRMAKNGKQVYQTLMCINAIVKH